MMERTLRSRTKSAPDSFLRQTPFEEDAILKTQWDGLHAQSQRSPELALRLAALEGGILEYWKYARADSVKGQRLAAEALAWVESDDVTWPFSFVPLCEALGIDPEYLRKGIRDLTGACDRRRALAVGRPPKTDPHPQRTGTKVCTRCKTERSVEHFTRRGDGRGYRSWCRGCMNGSRGVVMSGIGRSLGIAS